MFRTVLWFSHFGITLVNTIPKLHKVQLMEKQGKIDEINKYVHQVTSNWAMSQVKASGAKVNVYGQENIPQDIPVVFISNHQGNFDIPILMAYINKPKGFVAKIETRKIPVVRKWMEHIHCVFMDRNDIRQSTQTIIEAIKLIKEGKSFVIFPEGTRSKGGELGDFKAGSFKLATKPKVPIVPITIKGSYQLMEQNGNKIRPANVEVFIHPTIETEQLTKEEAALLPIRVKDIINSKL